MLRLIKSNILVTVPVLSSPAPLVVLVMDIGAIISAPPKLTIPPETVPILTPSRLTVNHFTLLPFSFIVCTGPAACLHFFKK